MATRRKSTSAPSKRAKPAAKRQWSAQVTQDSDAMDLQAGVFKLRSARAIAESLKKSAETSQRRKSSPFRSAMSMLNFEVDRAGKGLSDSRRRVLERAKVELRHVFGRDP